MTIPIPQVPQSNQILAGHVPTTVRAVESAYFKQHQYIQQIARPLAEVLGQGNFFFLQESELDSPEVPNNNQNAERPPVCQTTNQIGVRIFLKFIKFDYNYMSPNIISITFFGEILRNTVFFTLRRKFLRRYYI